jgi:hypothetical protein
MCYYGSTIWDAFNWSGNWHLAEKLAADERGFDADRKILNFKFQIFQI